MIFLPFALRSHGSSKEPEPVRTIINTLVLCIFPLLLFNGCFHPVHKKILSAEYFTSQHLRRLVPTGDSSNAIFATAKVPFGEKVHLP